MDKDKELKECFEAEEITEIKENIDNGDIDFKIGNYHFICMDDIDNILKDELSSDTYMLGCFTDWFISNITGLDIDIVTKAQKDKSFELLGELMLKEIDAVVEDYIANDGYGHHFAAYDGYEHEYNNYYFFKVN